MSNDNIIRGYFATQELIDRMNSVIDDIEQGRMDYARDTAQVVRDALEEIKKREDNQQDTILSTQIRDGGW
jgi:ribosome-binding protein aMBF1 (putative translation factor)